MKDGGFQARLDQAKADYNQKTKAINAVSKMKIKEQNQFKAGLEKAYKLDTVAFDMEFLSKTQTWKNFQLCVHTFLALSCK